MSRIDPRAGRSVGAEGPVSLAQQLMAQNAGRDLGPWPDASPDAGTGAVEALAERAEAETVALAIDLCVTGHDLDSTEGPACEECYAIACDVMDTPWLAQHDAQVAAAADAAAGERIAKAIEAQIIPFDSRGTGVKRQIAVAHNDGCRKAARIARAAAARVEGGA